MFTPMLIAGGITAMTAFGAQKLFRSQGRRRAGGGAASLTGWVVIASCCSAASVPLWGFWPEPTPRLV